MSNIIIDNNYKRNIYNPIYNHFVYDSIYDSKSKMAQHILALRKKENQDNINKDIYDYLAAVEKSDNLIETARFIMNNILNNYEFYVKLRLCGEYDYRCSLENLDNTNGIIYIKSLDELFLVADSNKLLLFCFNDLLIKLKLNTEITISNLYCDDDTYTEDIYYDSPDIHNKLKIGYINEESKMYNEDLTVYKENVDRLVEVFTTCILFQVSDLTSETLKKNNKGQTYIKNVINEEILLNIIDKFKLMFGNL